MAEAVEADLDGLILWLERVRDDYEHLHSSRRERRNGAKAVKRTKAALEGGKRGAAADALRSLIAAGVVRHRTTFSVPPERRLPELLMLGFIADAIWPLVLAKRLPADWVSSLGALASPQLARMVGYARQAKSDDAFSKRHLVNALAKTTFSVGVMNLLADLSDPKGGGAHLLALSTAAGAPPERGRTPRELLGWLVAGVTGAAATGVVGNRVDALVVDVWTWLSSSGSGASVLDVRIDSLMAPGADDGGLLDSMIDSLSDVSGID